MLKHLARHLLIFNATLAIAGSPTEALPLCEIVSFGDSTMLQRPGTFRPLALIPATWRAALASRSERFRAQHISELKREIAQLVPPEAARKMAAIRQSSQLGLVWDLPVLKSAAIAARAKQESPNVNPINYAVDLGYAQENAWINHLALVATKLEELLKLQELSGTGIEEVRERQKTHLSLAVLYAFSYGFEESLKTGSRDARSTVGNQLGNGFFETALQHFLHVQQSMKADPATAPEHKLLVNYMLGKHALNGVRIYSNVGFYDRNLQPLAPLPQAFKYLDLSRKILREVERHLQFKVNAGQPFSGWNEIFFETTNFLIEVHHWNARLRMDPDLEIAGNQMRFFEKKRLLIDILLAAPREWVQAHLALPEENILSTLINDLRWGYQFIHKNASIRDTFWNFEQHRHEISYDDFIYRLIHEARFNELKK